VSDGEGLGTGFASGNESPEAQTAWFDLTPE